MLGSGEYPIKNWVSGETINVEDWQDVADCLVNADTRNIKPEKWSFYWMDRNTKDILTIYNQTPTAHSSYTTLTTDGSISLINSASWKCLLNSTTYPEFNGCRTTGTWNFLTMTDGSSVTASEVKVLLSIYISDVSKYGSIGLYCGSDSSNYYAASWTSLSNGWNALVANLPDFQSVGSPPAWSNITYIRILGYTTVAAQNTYFEIDHLQIQRRESTYGYGSPFQRYTGGAWIPHLPTLMYNVFYARDANGVGWKQPCLWRSSSSLVPQYQRFHPNNFVNFYAGMATVAKAAGKTAGISFYIDSNNYVAGYIYDNKLYIDMYIAGALTTIIKSLGTSLLVNEDMFLYLQKEGTHIYFRAKHKNTGWWQWAEAEFSPTSSGSVGVGLHVAGGTSLIYDWFVGNKDDQVLIIDDNFSGIK